MKYKIIYDKRALRFIQKQSPAQQRRIVAAVDKLPHAGDRKAMAGHPGLYRLRVGNYRILYRVENDCLIVLVTDVGNRGDIYKGI